jgi:hypothetical protein
MCRKSKNKPKQKQNKEIQTFDNSSEELKLVILIEKINNQTTQAQCREPHS